MLYVVSCLNVEPKHKDNVIKKRTYFIPQSLIVGMRKIRKANKHAKQQLGGSRGWIKGSEQPVGGGSY